MVDILPTEVDKLVDNWIGRIAIDVDVVEHRRDGEHRVRGREDARGAMKLALLAADLRGCEDSEILLGVARSLVHNPEAAVARHLFTNLPGDGEDGEPWRGGWN